MTDNAFVQAFRLQNFMGFTDTGWVELRPITLLFGRNSTGKSALMRALLLLRQSILFPSEKEPFSYVVDGGFDFGNFGVLVRDHNVEEPIVVWFRCSIPQAPPPELQIDAPPSEYTRPGDLLGRWIEGVSAGTTNLYQVTVRLRLEYRFRKLDNRAVPHSVDLIDPSGDIIFQAITPGSIDPEEPWQVDSQFFNPDEPPHHPGILPGEALNVWKALIVFTSDSFLPRLRVLDETVELTSEDGGFGEDLITVYTVLERIRLEITEFLQDMDHLGPVRAAPQRFYYLAGRSARQDSVGGETARRLHSTHLDDRAGYDRIVDWMSTSTLQVKPKLVPIDKEKELYELVFVETGDDEVKACNDEMPVNINEVGSGLSQVLPVVVNTLLTPKNGMLLMEQPELHLHPRAQAELGDLFTSIAQQGVRCFIETHSEHLLLRLQKQIAKTTAGEISAAQYEQMLLPNQLAVYFINRKDNVSTVTQIEVGPYGDLLSTPEGFEDFFSDDVIETAERMRTRLAGMRKNN